jgi:ubiquitin-protein ligase
MDPNVLVGMFLDLGFDLDDIFEAMEGATSDEEVKKRLDEAKEKEKIYQKFKAEENDSGDEKRKKKIQEKLHDAEIKKNLKEKTLKENSINQKIIKISLLDTEKKPRVLRPFITSSLLSKTSFAGFSLPHSKKQKLKKLLTPSQNLEVIHMKINNAGPYLNSKRYSIHLQEFSNTLNQTLSPTNFSNPQNPFQAKQENQEKSSENPKFSTLKTLSQKPSKKVKLAYVDVTTGGIILNQPEENDPEAPDPKTEYFNLLSQFKVIESSDPLNFSNYIYTDPVNLSSEASRRISRELKTLEKSLPCDSEASIFFMYDNEDMGKMRVLVSGPSETVYSYGLYLFDVRIPADYPRSPPLVNLCTTGNGKVRFNPNMYHNGKVCLSIINTWKGNSDEMWNPSTSTLLQVFLSIQSMVMGNKIIQNEPTFEYYAEDSPENLQYQYEVRYGNLKYAIIEQFKNPPKGFEEVVQDHFLILKEKVLEYAENCLEKARIYKPFPNVKSQNPFLEFIFSSSSIYKYFQSFIFELIEIIK